MGKKMIKKLDYKFEYKDRTIEGVMQIDLSRFEGQYSKAQYELDSMVMTSMMPYMPKRTGTFINVTQGLSQSIAGSGKVVAAAPPMGRYLYEGKVMEGVKSKSKFAKKAEMKKVVKQPPQMLDYYRRVNTRVTDHWFETAKNNHGTAWLRKTKKLAGGG